MWEQRELRETRKIKPTGLPPDLAGCSPAHIIFSFLMRLLRSAARRSDLVAGSLLSAIQSEQLRKIVAVKDIPRNCSLSSKREARASPCDEFVFVQLMKTE